MKSFALAAMLLTAATAHAQDADAPVRMIVTVEAHHGKTPPAVTQNDVMVEVEKHRAQVIDWKPLRDAGSGMQLWILIDDGADSAIGSQFGELRKFIMEQPPSSEIGIGYLRNGAVDTRQRPTSDHDLVSKALRLPLGEAGISSSPYMSLTDLVHKWPPTDRAREILLITSGIDFFYGPGPDDPYLTRAIDDAQRAGVVVNSIYYGSAGHYGHSLWQINWGQNNLSQLADATGGELYWQGNSSPISLSPYLDELTRHFENQFLLTFAAQPARKAGLHPVKVRTEIPGVSLVGPTRVSVPARR